MIGAIIVLYNPNRDILRKGIEALSPQVDKVCVIDNSLINNYNIFKGYENVHYVPLLKNIGIAAAQNIGIKYFQDANYEYVIFSDQDSIAINGLVPDLLGVFKELTEKGVNVAAVGPMPINRATNNPYITQANIKAIYPKGTLCDNYNVHEMYSIISSFSIVKIASFNYVGAMEEDLFIDGVDDEWGWRAYNKGRLRSFIATDYTFSHFQGDDERVRYKKSTPFRSYFQFRNFIILFRRSYVPAYWKRRNLLKFGIKMFYYPICVSPRREYLKSIVQGIRDGIANKMGKK